jgi:hypothetical protein
VCPVTKIMTTMPAMYKPNKRQIHAPTFSKLFMELMALMLPNDPKLSHGANNRKREFAAKCKMKEQSPLAPARC